MPYGVLLDSEGTYSVLQNGVVVPKAKVTGVSFPNITSHTLHGNVHHITGPCVATIDVPNVGIVNNVPVKSPKP